MKERETGPVCVKAPQRRAILTQVLCGLIFLCAWAAPAPAQTVYKLKLLAQKPLPSSGQIADIDVSSTTAYVAAGVSGLRLYNVADATFPEFVSSTLTNVRPANFWTAVAVEGTRAYVGGWPDYNPTLKVVDVSIAAQPRVIGSTGLPARPSRIRAHKGNVFVLGGGSITFIDTVTHVEPPGTNLVLNATTFDNRSYILYVGTPTAVQVWDFTFPADPQPLTSLPVTGRVNDVHVSGDTLYVAAGDPDSNAGAVLVYDISSPKSPALRQQIPSRTIPWRIAADSAHVFVLNASLHLDVFTMSADQMLNPAGGISIEDRPDYYRADENRLFVRGGRLYVSSGLRGVQIFEIETSPELRRIGQFDTFQQAHGVAVSGNYCYVAALGGGLMVYDVTSATNPVVAAQVSTAGRALRVTLRGTRAYVACDYGGMEIFDVSRATAPTRLGWFPTEYAVPDVQVTGNSAFIPTGAAGLQIVDVSNPVTPVWLASISPPGTNKTESVALSQGYAAIRTSRGVTIADVANPGNPLVITNITLSSIPIGVRVNVGTNFIVYLRQLNFIEFQTVNGVSFHSALPSMTGYGAAVADYYLFTGGDGTLRVTDLSRDLINVGAIRGSHALSIAVSGNRIYSADAALGLVIHEGTPPPRVRVITPLQGTQTRAGQAVRVEWFADNSTNELWRVTYLEGGVHVPLEGTPSKDSFNHWWLDTSLPDASTTTTTGVIWVWTTDFALDGRSPTFTVEGATPISIHTSNSNVFLGWPVVNSQYQLLTKINIEDPWTLVESDTNSFYAPLTNYTRFFQLRRVEP